jgi:hypothetical protein
MRQDAVRRERACRKRRGVTAAALLLAVYATRPARAEPPTPQAIAQAEALFQEGKRLMSKGSYAEACPKLAESQKLDPGGGTIITLAICHESEGRTASAWAEFGEALTLALKDGRVDRVTVAREHGARLEPKLSRLVVRVPPSVSVLAALQITQDGIELGRPSWGMALPVDPGEHQIVVKAPGKKPWTRFVVVAADADRQELEVAPLEDEVVAPPSPAPAEAPRPAPSSGSAARNAAWVVGGAGVVLLGIGSYFGVRAISDHGTAKDRCPGSTCGDLEGVRANDSSQNEAEISTAGFAIGGAALGVAAFLLLTSSSSASSAPASRRARVRCEPRWLARGAGAVLSADW